MRTLKTTGGPLLCIDRESLLQWGGVLYSHFFGENSAFQNDYEEICDFLDRCPPSDISMVKGALSEVFIINLPLPTFIVETDDKSIHLVQIWSSERGWSRSNLTIDDFRNVTSWDETVEFSCRGGEFLIFDSSCPYDEIDDHFSVFLEKGSYRCESFYDKRKGQANIVLIRMLKQA